MTVEPQVDRVRAAYDAVHAPLWRAVLAHSGSAEAARLLGTAAATLRVQRMRARRRLRDLLEDHDA